MPRPPMPLQRDTRFASRLAAVATALTAVLLFADVSPSVTGAAQTAPLVGLRLPGDLIGRTSLNGGSFGLRTPHVGSGQARPTLLAQVPRQADAATTESPQADPAREARIKAAGIRRLDGQHLTLYTDLPGSPEIDSLPALFEQAIPEWCQYFAMPEFAQRPWHVTGCLMKDRTRFKAVGLLPADLPEFLHGYTRDNQIWIGEQPSDYYRRHLLLHEGAHAFMFAAFGTCGPPWYMEGMAELLGTHLLAAGKLRLAWFPPRREDVPMWGRVKLVREGLAAGRRLSLDQILAIGPQAHLKTEPYGWSWAAAAFLDGHPKYRERFRKLPAELRQPDFNARFRELFAPDWSELNEEWQLFVDNLDYGYDLAREAIDFSPGQPLPATGKKVSIAADRGWQSSGIRVEAGVEYRLTASGRYQVADKPRIWWCEPGGVSIRYMHGKPLGVLLAAVRPEPNGSVGADAHAGGFLQPLVVGLGTTLVPKQSGTLYLRINDSPAELADNKGTVDVRVELGTKH